MKFKIGDKVRIVADEEMLAERCISNFDVMGKIGIVKRANSCDGILKYDNYDVEIGGESTWCYYEQDLELADPAFETHPEGVLEIKDQPIRTFDTGATRDTAQGKLDYVKALSPIVLRRYVQYLDKHRLQPDGSYRAFDNWKKGIPQNVYHSGGGRHFMDTWLLTEGYPTEDNHGPVEIEDAICAQLFNLMGRLHEMLRPGVADRAAPVEGGY